MYLFRRLALFCALALSVPSIGHAQFGPFGPGWEWSELLPPPSIIERVRQTGLLRVGQPSFTMPYAMCGEDGALMGLTIDLVNRLASSLGVDAQFVETGNASTAIEDLESRRTDTVLLGVLTSRAVEVNYAAYIGEAIQHVVIANINETQAETLEELNAAGVVLAAQRSATAHTIMDLRFPEAIRFTADTSAELYDLVSTGVVDAVVHYHPNEDIWPDQADHLAPVGEPFDTIPYAFALPKGDHDAVNTVSAWVAEHGADGIDWFDERRAYWFENVDAWIDDVAVDQAACVSQ